jgi:predicted metal-dependent hydrolase
MPVKGELEVMLGGRPVSVPIRRDRRARQITIHIDASLGGAKVVMPTYATLTDARNAMQENEQWLLDRLSKLPPRIPFEDGSVIPVLGRNHRIRHIPGRRGSVEHVDGEIWVYGQPEHLSRRVTDWLKTEARHAISPLCLEKAADADRRVRRVVVRSQRSRWGSCGSNGHLSFNWRLILAPEAVLDYVVAHEVAHLVEMNHSPAFWRVVRKLTPHTRYGKDWLNRNGQKLYRYG